MPIGVFYCLFLASCSGGTDFAAVVALSEALLAGDPPPAPPPPPAPLAASKDATHRKVGLLTLEEDGEEYGDDGRGNIDDDAASVGSVSISGGSEKDWAEENKSSSSSRDDNDNHDVNLETSMVSVGDVSIGELSVGELSIGESSTEDNDGGGSASGSSPVARGRKSILMSMEHTRRYYK